MHACELHACARKAQHRVNLETHEEKGAVVPAPTQRYIGIDSRVQEGLHREPKIFLVVVP